MPAKKQPTRKKPAKARKPTAKALATARLHILEQLRADLDLGPLQHVAGYDKGLTGFGRYGKSGF